MSNDLLQVQGINDKGFGTVPKLVMQDKRLSPQAKAIYAYFCSYAGSGNTAFPSRNKIMSDLNIGKNAYYKHFTQLKDYGYIKAAQEHKGGRLTRNIYTLISTIPASVQCPSFEDTEKQDPQNGDTINNNSSGINRFKYNQSSQSEQTDGTDAAATIEAYTALIKDNIAYEDFKTTRPHEMNLIDEMVTIILDVVVSKGAYVAIGGEDKPRELVKSNLLSLGHWDIDHALDQFKSLTTPIKKKKQYILTMLYNCKMEKDSHFTNLVNSHMAGGAAHV